MPSPVISPIQSPIREHASLDFDSDGSPGVPSQMTFVAFLADFKNKAFQPEPPQNSSSHQSPSKQASVPNQSSSSEFDGPSDQNYDAEKEADDKDIPGEENSTPAPIANVSRRVTSSARTPNPASAADPIAEEPSSVDSSYELSTAYSPLFYTRQASFRFKALINRSFVDERKRKIDLFNLNRLTKLF